MNKKELIESIDALRVFIDSGMGNRFLSMIIEALDQPEIIICKKCEYYHPENFSCEINGAGWRP